jgi:hypothetical protein
MTFGSLEENLRSCLSNSKVIFLLLDLCTSEASSPLAVFAREYKASFVPRPLKDPEEADAIWQLVRDRGVKASGEG